MRKDSKINKAAELLVQAITRQVEKKEKVAIPFSGSLDSSLVAFVTLKYTNTDVQLYTIGYPDCYDFEIARKSADKIWINKTATTNSNTGNYVSNYMPKRTHTKPISHIFITLTDEMVERNYEEYVQLTNDENKVSISYTLPFFILLKHIGESNILTGHGADTLCGGFHKYLKSNTLKKDITHNYVHFLNMLPKREFIIGKHLNKKILIPFTDTALSDHILSLPDNFLIRNGERKWILKKVAEELDLPREIINLPKKAFQYSSGIQKTLRKTYEKPRKENHGH